MVATLVLAVEILEYLELEAKEAQVEHKAQEDQPLRQEDRVLLIV